MGVIIYSFNSNISPKISYGVYECELHAYRITELHAYDFVIKDFVIKRGITCSRTCTSAEEK